jgi:hypothetical protein
MRVTIRKHHQPLLNTLALEMGCSASEALNYLLWQHRWRTPQPQAVTKLKSQFQPKSPQAIQQFEESQLQQDIDPIINRIAALIEDF